MESECGYSFTFLARFQTMSCIFRTVKATSYTMVRDILDKEGGNSSEQIFQNDQTGLQLMPLSSPEDERH